MKTSGFHITQDHIFQPRFINRDNTLLQISNLIRIHIYTSYIHAGFGKTRSGNKPYIPGSYNRYIHFI